MSRSLRSWIPLSLLTLTVVFTLGASTVLGAESAPEVASPSEITSPPAADPQPGCSAQLEVLDLQARGEGFSRPAAEPTLDSSEPLPQWLGKPQGPRTCACSCGAPCTIDADCGFGGICITGFTCC